LRDCLAGIQCFTDDINAWELRLMKLGFSGEAFSNLLVLNAFVMGPIILAVCIIAHRRGLDVTTHRFQITVLVTVVLIFVIIPISLCDHPIRTKIIGIALGAAVCAGNYVGVDRMRRVLWGDSVDKKKNGDKKS
jgi:hypothetical protein